jgi:hypothetical protein
MLKQPVLLYASLCFIHKYIFTSLWISRYKTSSQINKWTGFEGTNIPSNTWRSECVNPCNVLGKSTYVKGNTRRLPQA